MPTVDQPRHFETGALMPSKYDGFFKWASIDADHQTGNVESPGGFVSLMYVEAQTEVAEYVMEAWGGEGYGDASLDDLRSGITTGWYVTLQDNNGIIWSFTFGDGTLAEENARREFAGSEAYYAAWDEENGE